MPISYSMCTDDKFHQNSYRSLRFCSIATDAAGGPRSVKFHSPALSAVSTVI